MLRSSCSCHNCAVGSSVDNTLSLLSDNIVVFPTEAKTLGYPLSMYIPIVS